MERNDGMNNERLKLIDNVMNIAKRVADLARAEAGVTPPTWRKKLDNLRVEALAALESLMEGRGGIDFAEPLWCVCDDGETLSSDCVTGLKRGGDGGWLVKTRSVNETSWFSRVEDYLADGVMAICDAVSRAIEKQEEDKPEDETPEPDFDAEEFREEKTDLLAEAIMNGEDGDVVERLRNAATPSELWEEAALSLFRRRWFWSRVEEREFWKRGGFAVAERGNIPAGARAVFVERSGIVGTLNVRGADVLVLGSPAGCMDDYHVSDCGRVAFLDGARGVAERCGSVTAASRAGRLTCRDCGAVLVAKECGGRVTLQGNTKAVIEEGHEDRRGCVVILTDGARVANVPEPSGAKSVVEGVTVIDARF